MHIDGESIDAGKEITVKIIPKGLHVLAPKRRKGRKRPLENDPVLSVFLRVVFIKITMKTRHILLFSFLT